MVTTHALPSMPAAPPPMVSTRPPRWRATWQASAWPQLPSDLGELGGAGRAERVPA